MKKILRLVVIGFVSFIILKISTFGGKPISKTMTSPKSQNVLLAHRLQGHVYKLSEEIGDRNILRYDKLEEAANYITGQFKACNYNIEFQEYIVEGKKAKNIVAFKKGSILPDEIIIIGAHYDSCFNPGADDNASGIAGLLELARFMAGEDNNRTIKFIAFVNEEPPYFKTDNMGSLVYVKEVKAKGENIKAAVILESIGYYTDKANSQKYPPIVGFFYPNKGNFISVIGNFKSASLVTRITKIFKKNSKFPVSSMSLGFIPGVDFSDNWSFWKKGYAAVMITDTAFLRYENYHKNTDTWEKLDYESMACVVEGLSSVLATLTK